MIPYNIFIVDSDVLRKAKLKSLIDDFCPFLNVVGEYEYFFKALIETAIRKPNIIFLEAGLLNDQNKLIFEEMNAENILFIFINQNAPQMVGWDSIRGSYSVEETLYEINTIIKRKSFQLDTTLYASIKSGVLAESGKDFFTVSSLDKIEILRIKEILYCQADGKYTSFFMKCGRMVVASKNIGEFEQILVKRHFYRIHQTYIVNVCFVVRILKKEGFFCELQNGTILPIASRRQEEFCRYLSRK